MEPKVSVSVLYLGKRGGGAKVASQICKDLKNSTNFSIASICVRSDNESYKEYDQSKIVNLFDDLNSRKTIIKLLEYLIFPSRLLAVTGLGKRSFCLVPMISPLGLIVEAILKFQGVEVVRLLHDFEKHPGDKWPPKFITTNIVKRSDSLIALSNEVAKKIRILNPKIHVSIYPHPVFEFPSIPKGVVNEKKYFLFIGRIRKYKGVENLIKAFTTSGMNDTELVIAGEGKISLPSDPRIKVINRWLDEYEIFSLIDNAEVVVFPYVEASQSGILPYCVRRNKKVVVTPLPGLLEQISSYQNAFVVGDLEVESLNLALTSAIGAELFFEQSVESPSKNIEECLLQLGIFTV
jgi:glycosyltransferase involved in cell wall biosynthesis